MGRPRTFDWDEAERLYALTGNYRETARRMGVTGQAIRYALQPELREYHSATQRESKRWRKPCPGGCGGWATEPRSGHSGYCRACSSKRRTTSVRDDELRCGTCRAWLPDKAFARQASATWRRGRHGECRACNTKSRRARRQASPELSAAYDKAYRARRRAQAIASHS